jgi:hypothetical protein
MAYDLWMLYHNCYAELPPTFEDWRAKLLSEWPPLYDTKYIFTELDLIGNTGIEHLFNALTTRK